jgi:toxin YoeB
MVKRINQFIKNIGRTPFEGIGKPEGLKHEYSGFWSRRIDEEHRLVYTLDKQKNLVIFQCRYHYKKS